MDGRGRAGARDRRAAARGRAPGHAYLLVGPRGSGVEDAARDVRGAADRRGRRRAHAAARRARACIPTSSSSNRAARRTRSTTSARRSCPRRTARPIEGERKVLILFEAERLLGTAERVAANALLKTLEEPPAAHGHRARDVERRRPAADDPSRCQRVDFDPVPDDTLRAALEREGLSAGAAQLAASLSGGQLARARALAGPARQSPRAVRARARSPRRHRRDRARDRGAARRGRVAAPPTKWPAATRRSWPSSTPRWSGYGYSDRDAQRMRRRIDERHKRELRRTRIDLLLEGVTAIETVYRDVLAAPAPAVEHRPAAARAAIRAPRPRRSTRAGTRARRSRSTRRASCVSSRS